MERAWQMGCNGQSCGVQAHQNVIANTYMASHMLYHRAPSQVDAGVACIPSAACDQGVPIPGQLARDRHGATQRQRDWGMGCLEPCLRRRPGA